MLPTHLWATITQRRRVALHMNANIRADSYDQPTLYAIILNFIVFALLFAACSIALLLVK
jgi:hypothetical protein